MFKLAEYTKALPDKAALSLKDLAPMAGLSPMGLYERVKAGKFPPPDFDSKASVSHGAGGYKQVMVNSRHKHHWTLATLRKFEKQQVEGAAHDR